MKPSRPLVAALLALHFVLPAAIRPSFARPSGAGVRSMRMEDGSSQMALNRSAAWQQFRSRFGDWRAEWNEITSSPHRAFGPPIRVVRGGIDAASVDAGVREFVATHSEIFGYATLRTVNVHRAGRVWYAIYEQTSGGVPVAFSDWTFRVGVDGDLFLFGADARAIPAGVVRTPGLARAAAREAARHAATGSPSEVNDAGMVLVPWGDDDRTELRLAFDERVASESPPGRWVVYVDAHTGEVLWRHDQVHESIAGTVTGTVHALTVDDGLVSHPFPDLEVMVDYQTLHTNANGGYSATSVFPQSGVHARLKGRFCVVSNGNAPTADFSTVTSDPSAVDIPWTDSNSTIEERDAYYHIQVAHHWIRDIDPAFSIIDYAMPCSVNVASLECNATWFGIGTGLKFGTAANGCRATASMPDVVYHEYGHAINDLTYLQFGIGTMVNYALHEGMADVNSCLLRDDPEVGKGFYGPGTILRTIANSRRWPQDQSCDPHETGLIIGGAFWDLRQSLGLAPVSHLVQFARHGEPDDLDDDMAMHEFFLETLVVDDNNGNLADGTPNVNQIIAAFNAHGIGTQKSITIAHTQTNGSDTIDAGLGFSFPYGQVLPGTFTLHYSLHGLPFVSVGMSDVGFDHYRAQIPAQNSAVASYYFTVSGSAGETVTWPEQAPAFNTYQALMGIYFAGSRVTMDSDPGWTVGGPSDNAIDGIWVRDRPNGTEAGNFTNPVQPGEDYDGGKCWFTGNGVPFEDIDAHDVDGGRTTLTTALFAGATFPRMAFEYYRWYTNCFEGSPQDEWRVELSNDGGVSWVPIENTSASLNRWARRIFIIGDHLIPTNNMKLRFMAQDGGAPGTVEAAVDDFRLFSYFGTNDVDETAVHPATLSFARPAPNPAGATVTFRFSLPAAGAVSLDVYDTQGRLVRSIVRGRLSAGDHALPWDGHDGRGGVVENGVYFATLRAGGESRTHPIVRLQ